MDLLLYERPQTADPQNLDLSSAAGAVRDVQGQAAAWLQRVVLRVVPGLATRASETDDGHG